MLYDYDLSKIFCAKLSDVFGKFREDFNRPKQKSDRKSLPSGPYFDNCITKWGSFDNLCIYCQLLTQWGKRYCKVGQTLLQSRRNCHFKMRQLLHSGVVSTNIHVKVGKMLFQNEAVFSKWGITMALNFNTGLWKIYVFRRSHQRCSLKEVVLKFAL